jgi:multiple sugar transport system permease protein
MGAVNGRRRIGRWVFWLFLAIGAMAMVLPFYWMVLTSLKSKSEIVRIPPSFFPQSLTLGNYVEAWERLDFPILLRNSAFLAFTMTVTILFSSSLVGYVFAKIEFPGRELLFVVILSSMMIPFNVVMIPLFLLIVKLHWANTYWGIIIPGIFSSFGIFLMRQVMGTIPDELLDAARIDGASEFRIFGSVALPLSTSPLAALGTLTFMGQWDAFLWPLIVLTRGDLFTLPVGLALFNNRFYTEYGPLLAGATISVIPILIVFLFAQRLFIESVALQGMKL